MHYLKCVAGIVAFIIPFAANAQISLSMIDHGRIETYTESIRNQFISNVRHRQVAKYVGLAALGGAGLWLLSKKSVENSQEVVGLTLAQSKKVFEYMDLIKRGLEEKQIITTDLGFWRNAGSWLYSNGVSIFHTAIAMQLLQVATGVVGPVGEFFKRFEGLVSKQLGKVFYDGDLAWFINNHAHLRILFNQIESQAALSQGMDIEHAHDLFSDHIDFNVVTKDPTYAMQAFETSWSLLMQDVEHIIAFIAYKKECTQEQMPLIAIRFGAIQQKLIQITQDATQQIEAELNNEQPEQLLNLIKKYRASLELELHSFSDFESLLN